MNENTAHMDSNELNKIIIKRKTNCPVCNNNFDHWDVASYKVRIVKSDSDLRNYFEPFDPLYYSVIICPKCGYAALRSVFPKLKPKEVELIRKSITPRYKHIEYPQVYTIDDAISRCGHALLNASAKEAKASEKGLLSLQMSWLCREKGDSGHESSFRENAIKNFVDAFQNERFPMAGLDSPTMTYLLGELYRRSGKLEEASKFISEVVVMRDIPARLKERAIDIKNLIAQERAATTQA